MKPRELARALALLWTLRVPGPLIWPWVVLLVFVNLVVVAAGADTCARYGRMTETETRYTRTLGVFPGVCWVKYPEMTGWTPLDWTERS